MKDFKGGEEFNWSDLQPDSPYPHELIGHWIDSRPNWQKSMAFFQKCSDVLLEEGALPADWQRYLVFLMQDASQAVLNDESIRDSKLARVLGLSGRIDLTNRNYLIAVAVRWRVNRDTKQGKVDRASIEVWELLKDTAVVLTWESVKSIYEKQNKSVMDTVIPYIESNLDELGDQSFLFLAE